MRTPILAAGLTLAAALLTPLPAPAEPAPGKASAAAPTTERAAKRQIARTAWDTGAELRAGTRDGVRVRKGGLRISEASGTRSYNGDTYEAGTWTSPWVSPGFGLTELIASWEARTRGAGYLEVAVRGQAADGRTSSWDVLGRWADADRHVRRTSLPGQGDDLADVNVDTWQASTPLTSWQLQVTLLRRPGARSPRLDAVGAMASRLPAVSDVATSRPGPGAGTVLPVPRYSQMMHRGHYPTWGAGGQAWCSPTSTSMVLGYYDALPPAKAYDWVPDDHVDPWVDHAARRTYDASYRGTGNWPFNTAYAATRTDHAFVTRLRNLREAGRFIEAGIPLIASLSWSAGRLDNAPPETRNGSNGHLLVIVGFRKNGDVVVNDPAAEDRAGVRRVYDRGQFEDAWLPKSGGLVYVIHDAAHPLPGTKLRNW
ncbi:peptidase C39 family protein [Nocardioides sp. GCM10027113]|uniref:peptidase C39 family protein n=1 Tax=unclassified Nocardioides TaxID=2615069 RepID=UPI00360A574F